MDISTNDDINDDNFKVYKSSLENSQDIIILLNLYGKIVYVNKKSLEYYGYSKDEFLSINICKLRNIHNNSTDMDKHIKNTENKRIEFQTVHYKKDGSSFPAEISCVRVNHNSEILILNIIKDITDTIEKEEEMQLLASILENSDDAIISKTLDGIITSWNRGAELIYGYNKDEIIGKSISILLPEESKEDIFLILDKVKNNIKINHYETLRVNKDGKKLFISISVSPIYNSNKDVIGAYTIARNITGKVSRERELRDKYEELTSIYEELTATEEELRTNYIELGKAKTEAENANAAKSQFLANMSHEIRTPLNGIIGAVELLNLMNLSKDEQPYIKILKNSSKHLLNIINNILDISKIESGNIDVSIKVFDFKNMMDRLIKEISFACTNKQLEFTYFIDPLIPHKIAGDELKLKQVLINLFNNAIKFTDKGSIMLKVKLQSQLNEKIILKFCIKDTGIGIKNKFQKNIFKKFTQQDISYNKYYAGTGLGLSISKELVKIMNGDIWFESTEDKGSTFYFTSQFLLDFSESAYNSSNNLNTNITFSLSKSDKTILIVEDNDINMKITCDMLKKLGYNYICAYNGKQALELLETNNVDLILMDVQMPELNGLDTTKIIRKNEIHNKSHIPIVAMTAYSMSGDREICIESGMDDYIAKPFSIRTIRTITEKFLR
ncbi:PAS domain S-box protein [Clostridium tyrobutyricum]|nr:PAS domain S-box protein [Clostridium tyrobutyricum]MBV4419785.1 PAS domain S-box protein [Clostridium tyrobutyricum]